MFLDCEKANIILRAMTQAECDEWYEVLRSTIDASQGRRYRLQKLLKMPDFQKKQAILEKDFLRECNSGDLLLFKDNHFFARMQRLVTKSEYDHVGLVLKNRKNEVVVFQSNSNSGVAFAFWNQMIKYKWYNQIQKIAWRKLNINRSIEILSKMEKFIFDNLDKKFGLTLAKIRREESTMQVSQEQEKKRTYFCSELVAKFYKEIGLLDKLKSSTQYWPVDFSDAKKLTLLYGSLEEERIIVFQEAVLKDQYQNS